MGAFDRCQERFLHRILGLRWIEHPGPGEADEFRTVLAKVFDTIGSGHEQ